MRTSGVSGGAKAQLNVPSSFDGPSQSVQQVPGQPTSRTRDARFAELPINSAGKNKTSSDARRRSAVLPSSGEKRGSGATSMLSTGLAVAAATNVEMKTLATGSVVATHPQHGKLTLTREAKAANQNRLSFTMKLQENDGTLVTGSHAMFVTRSAPNYPGQSAVGYNYIDLDDLQGKGIGNVYHAAAARAARELGVDLFVVDKVSEEPMRRLCEGAGMNASWDNYSLAPAEAEHAFQQKAASKGWNIRGLTDS